ncbi:MAG: segregation/condensation protein A [Holophagaceae bacterium]|jgi:segregation and condensation protein A|nr:segregation/condensation protein A [Holophagaceae bacterium]
MEDVSQATTENIAPARVFEPPSGFESKFRDMALDLPLFEGPLDLLLYLIRDQKLDILDLPMASITKQYMSYLRLMEELSLEIAAEFIVMAAQLAQIKSRMLLPVPPKEGEPEDPREDLVYKLLQYQAIQEATQELAERECHWQDIIFAGGLDLQEYTRTEEEPIRATVMDLLGAYREILKSWMPPPPVEIMAPPKTIEQRIAEVLELLRGSDWCLFAELFAKSNSREDLVITFLALLELVKIGRARVLQTEAFGEIRIQAA